MAPTPEPAVGGSSGSEAEDEASPPRVHRRVAAAADARLPVIGLPPPAASSDAAGRGFTAAEAAGALAPAQPGRPPKPVKRRHRRDKTFLEFFLHEMQKPEVILMSVWWLILLVLVVYLADLGLHLRSVWRPLVLLGSIPVMFSIALCIVTS
eukprot:gnl/TRDRNA2_/TRDRNA2_85374_c0_seq2.p1 gnl/TRDRNA2_/TRDRNA2_85374_c0~~gnl/TRDRNA2_/TRDRNA2_85374_c0_seq2.p1  ORF type:complete len:171 (+),score=36.00 gnl/TRDRNA2_/TRDRNA2_85374_c0_seq2:59-514(+)